MDRPSPSPVPLVPAAHQPARADIYWVPELLSFALATPERRRGIQRLALAHLHRQVSDEDLRAGLTPDYTNGCQRTPISDDWYPTLAEPNVDVVTDPIAEVRPHGIVTADGAERPAAPPAASTPGPT